MLSAPPGAQCAIHPANPASGVCERCGNFMCADCTPNGEPRCPTCRAKDATPEFPFDANSTFTELFNHVVEQFKRDPSMPIIGTIIYFGMVMVGSVVSNIFTQAITAIAGANLNDADAIRADPMVLVRAVLISYVVSIVIQTLTQAVALSAFYRLMFDLVNGRKGDLGRMFGHLKALPKYLALQVTVFMLNFIAPMVVFGGAVFAVLKVIGFDWSNPSHTRPEDVLAPVPMAIVFGALMVILVFSIVMLPVSIFAMPELVVGDCTPTEAIARAFQLGSGQRLRILGYGLVLAIMQLLGFAACCVGLLVTIPVMYMVWAALFLALRKNSGLPPPGYT